MKRVTRNTRTRKGDGGLAALLLGLTLAAAAPASAGEESPKAGHNPATEPAETSRNQAADAHEEAASRAAEAVISATKLDLDIRLVSHTSVQVANDLL